MTIEERLQRLEDIEAIRNLISRYSPLTDSGQAEAVARIWTEDGEYDIGGFTVAKGRAAISAAINSEPHRNLMESGSAHVLSSPHIELNGDNAVATCFSVLFRRQSEAFETYRVAASRWELVRQADGEWLATKRINRLLDGSDEARQILAAIA